MEIIDVMMRLVDGVTAPLRSINSQLAMTAKQQNAMGRNIQRLGRDITGVGQALMPVSAGIVPIVDDGRKGIAGGRSCRAGVIFEPYWHRYYGHRRCGLYLIQQLG